MPCPNCPQRSKVRQLGPELCLSCGVSYCKRYGPKGCGQSCPGCRAIHFFIPMKHPVHAGRTPRQNTAKRTDRKECKYQHAKDGCTKTHEADHWNKYKHSFQPLRAPSGASSKTQQNECKFQDMQGGCHKMQDDVHCRKYTHSRQLHRAPSGASSKAQQNECKFQDMF